MFESSQLLLPFSYDQFKEFCNFTVIGPFLSVFLQFMPVLRKSGTHKTALRQTLDRNGHLNVQPILKFAIPALYHLPTPNIPVMNLLQFELVLLSYLLVAMVIQYMNIYKANFYVMDYYLVLFITMILMRRVGWLVLKQTLASEVMDSVQYWSKVALKTLLLLSLFLLCLWSVYNVIQTSALEDVLFLCYPFGVYLWTFGFTLNPYSHSVLFKLGQHQSYKMQDVVSNNTSLFHQAVTLQPVTINAMPQLSTIRNKNKILEFNGNLLHHLKSSPKEQQQQVNGHSQNGSLGAQTSDESNADSDICNSKQSCAMSPDTVRYEAECLRTDFNLRVKQILFNSIVSAYYVGFIPLKFTQNGWLYYDLWWSTQHIVFVWLNTFMLLTMYLVPHHYIDGLHKCALHLGAWKKYTGQRETPHVWSPLTVWPQAALVRHNKGLFRGVEKQNTAVPGDTHHSRFYFIFSTPLRLINWLASIQMLSVLGQFYVLSRSTFWYQSVSIVVMSSISYYLLFRLLRERWAVQATMNEHNTCTNSVGT